MEIISGSEEGFVREWTPCSHILNLIPTRIQSGLFSNELCLTCVDAVSEYIALGTNIGLVYWYDRKKGAIKKLRCEASTSPITFVKIVNTVDYMVGAGNAAGQVTVFQIPKEHPENVPDVFKPKEEPKVERYTIGDLHKSEITAIEWSKNGMRLFSGDKNGVIIMTELDFYMHLCKSMEIVNEEYEIVQMSYYQNTLLVSSLYRTIVCEKKDNKWQVSQLGKKERKSLSSLGAVFQYSYARGGAAVAFCARQGHRLWRADKDGNVHHTLLFKDAISNPITVAELLNPSQKKHSHDDDQEYNFGPIHVFKEHFLVTHNEQFLYILDPRSLTAVAVVDDLRRILSVSVNKDEIFILEGPHSLVRLAHTPEPATLLQEDPIDLMTKSLTSSLHQAVNTVRDLTQNQTVPFIASVLEQPLNIFSKNDAEVIICAEECFELPPIRHLPNDISNNVLESIVHKFKDVSNDLEEIRRIKEEEFDKKLKLYNSIIEKKQDDELIYSRRGRKKEIESGGSTPRTATPVRKADVSYTSPCLMNVSVYGNQPVSDEQLELEIEEKEKMLAKMLNLESLSIKSANIRPNPAEEEYKPVKPTYKKVLQETIEPEHIKNTIKSIMKENSKQKVQSNVEKSNVDDLVPKLVKLPINWNLDIKVKPDTLTNGKRSHSVTSPDDTIGNDWEII